MFTLNALEVEYLAVTFTAIAYMSRQLHEKKIILKLLIFWHSTLSPYQNLKKSFIFFPDWNEKEIKTISLFAFFYHFWRNKSGWPCLRKINNNKKLALFRKKILNSHWFVGVFYFNQLKVKVKVKKGSQRTFDSKKVF